jgi:hypothetical protein
MRNPARNHNSASPNFNTMDGSLSSIIGTLLAAAALLGLYMAYRAALPKPLADIPYNRDAAKGLFGDVPEMMRYVLHR